MGNKPRTDEERDFVWTFDKTRILKIRYPEEGPSERLAADLGCPTTRELTRMAAKQKLSRPPFRDKCRRRDCDLPVVVDHFCLYHWVMFRLQQAKVITTDDDELCEAMRKKFDDMGRKCYYSGRELVPGVNVSVDHTVPASFGGTATVDNLEWVDSDVNFAKRVMSCNEYINMCTDVALYSTFEKQELNPHSIHYMIDWFNQHGYNDIAEVISKYVKS